MARRTVIKALVVGTAGLALPGLGLESARADERTMVRGRHLSYGADPRTEMNVGFAVDLSFAKALVATRASNGSARSAHAAVTMVRGSATQYCHAAATELEANTEYGYQVVLDGQVKSHGSFKTAPDRPLPFRFTAFGDQDTGPVPTRMLSRVNSLNQRLHLMCGDLCYADSTGEGSPDDGFRSAHWDTWLNMNDAVAGRLPWMSVPGNHEIDPVLPARVRRLPRSSVAGAHATAF